MKNSSKMPAVAKKNRTKPKPSEKGVKKPLILSNRNNKRSPKKPTGERNEKGIIYVKHLPHGFFENQLRTFFCQFGDVTRVHVARSKKTLRSRGYAYVEFRYREVAQIAAETMNNYLMFNKLLKTGLLPAGAKHIPRKYEKAFDANGNETTTYKLWLKRTVAKSNAPVTKTKVVNRNRRALGKLQKMKKKFAELGVEYNVDEIVPKYDENDLKVPEHDAEEAEIQAKKNKRKAKQQQKLEDVDTSVLSAIDEMSADSSDDEEDGSFVPLKSTDWDVAMSDDEDSAEENQPAGPETKSAAVELANKTKIRFDKEKKQTSQKSKKPLVLRPPSSTETTPKKPAAKKVPAKSANESLSHTEPDSSPEKSTKGGKKKSAARTNAKGRKVAGSGGVAKKPKGKKEPVQKKATSPVKGAAKALLNDPSVKKAQAKDIKKKKKNK